MQIEKENKLRELSSRPISLVELDELVELQHEKRMEEIAERGLVRIDPADGLIILNGVYEIDEEIDSVPKFIDWLFHLREKVWFTAQMQDDFLYLLERHYEYNFRNMMIKQN
ncbi:MAG: hypothetical protein U0929_09675 [Planctomycetaceae bacterium]